MIGIKGRSMPDICQDCPCFNLIDLDEQIDVIELIQIKLCRASGMTLGARDKYKKTPYAWFHTERPEWCPLVDIPDITITRTMIGEVSNEDLSRMAERLQRHPHGLGS